MVRGFKDDLERYPISEKEKITILKRKLKCDARYTFEGIQPHAMNSLEKLGKAMEKIFGIAHDTREWLIKLNKKTKTFTAHTGICSSN